MDGGEYYVTGWCNGCECGEPEPEYPTGPPRITECRLEYIGSSSIGYDEFNTILDVGDGLLLYDKGAHGSKLYKYNYALDTVIWSIGLEDLVPGYEMYNHPISFPYDVAETGINGELLISSSDNVIGEWDGWILHQGAVFLVTSEGQLIRKFITPLELYETSGNFGDGVAYLGDGSFVVCGGGPKIVGTSQTRRNCVFHFDINTGAYLGIFDDNIDYTYNAQSRWRAQVIDNRIFLMQSGFYPLNGSPNYAGQIKMLDFNGTLLGTFGVGNSSHNAFKNPDQYGSRIYETSKYLAVVTGAESRYDQNLERCVSYNSRYSRLELYHRDTLSHYKTLHDPVANINTSMGSGDYGLFGTSFGISLYEYGNFIIVGSPGSDADLEQNSVPDFDGMYGRCFIYDLDFNYIMSIEARPTPNINTNLGGLVYMDATQVYMFHSNNEIQDRIMKVCTYENIE